MVQIHETTRTKMGKIHMTQDKRRFKRQPSKMCYLKNTNNGQMTFVTNIYSNKKIAETSDNQVSTQFGSDKIK